MASAATVVSTVNNNIIENSSCFGVYADDLLSGDPLDATNNWWGDASGPQHPVDNPSGLGNAVSDNVVFDIDNQLIISAPAGIVFNAAGTTAFVADWVRASLIALDLASTSRTTVSGANTGSGPQFGNPYKIALNAAGTHGEFRH